MWEKEVSPSSALMNVVRWMYNVFSHRLFYWIFLSRGVWTGSVSTWVIISPTKTEGQQVSWSRLTHTHARAPSKNPLHASTFWIYRNSFSEMLSCVLPKEPFLWIVDVGRSAALLCMTTLLLIKGWLVWGITTYRWSRWWWKSEIFTHQWIENEVWNGIRGPVAALLMTAEV